MKKEPKNGNCVCENNVFLMVYFQNFFQIEVKKNLFFFKMDEKNTLKTIGIDARTKKNRLQF